MDRTILIARFKELTKEELREELKLRNEKLSKALVIEDMDNLIEEIEALEFMLNSEENE